MRAREIAETLVNGNITLARHQLARASKTKVLDVVEELAALLYDDEDTGFEQAIYKVRSLL